MSRAASGLGRARPTSLPWQPVTAWAGPWPTDEGWWSGGAGPSARFQVVGADGRAWLLLRGARGLVAGGGL